MRRRQFITLLGSAAALWPITADAQRPKTRVAGLVFSGSADGFAHLLVALRQGLREKGYVEGQNLTIEYRWADGDYDRLPALAADLVRRDVTLIISTGIVAARAVKAATTEIPIVFASGDDPVRFGIVPTLSHPGGNVTGVTIMSSALVPKRFEIVRELLPRLRRLGLMVNAKNPNAEANVKDAEAAARTIGEDPLVLWVEAAELDSAFREFVKQGVDTVLITTDPDFNSA
jgi:ABC-type uncharacterized transport system substrate-binding protein